MGKLNTGEVIVNEVLISEGDMTKSIDVEKRALSSVAKRALAETDVRRIAAVPQNLLPENGGPKGLEPTRYGDWEKKGITSDF